MAQVSFGTILQNEREQQGYDLSTVARRLRIRVDILQAIEESDFARMPPRGYARNMVNAYARFLGLNSTEITRLYLDEVYADQVKKARSNARPSGFDMSPSSSGRRTQKKQTSHQNNDARMDRASGRIQYVDNAMNRNRDAETARVYSAEQTHRSVRSAVPTTHYTNFYAGPKATNSLSSKLPFILGGVVLLIVLIVIVVFVFGPRAGGEDTLQKVPVTGISDSNQGNTTDTSGAQSETKPAATPPTKVVFTYKIASGESAWIEIYRNGEKTASEASTLPGPLEKSEDVTTTLKFVTARPSAVKVFQDETELTLQQDPNTKGVYTVTVNFQEVLDAWYKAHPEVQKPSTQTAATGTSAN